MTSLVLIGSNAGIASASDISFGDVVHKGPLLIDEFPKAKLFVDEFLCKSGVMLLSLHLDTRDALAFNSFDHFLRVPDEIIKESGEADGDAYSRSVDYTSSCASVDYKMKIYLSGEIISEYKEKEYYIKVFDISRYNVELNYKIETIDDYIRYYYLFNSSSSIRQGWIPHLSDKALKYAKDNFSDDFEFIISTFGIFDELDLSLAHDNFVVRPKGPAYYDELCSRGLESFCGRYWGDSGSNIEDSKANELSVSLETVRKYKEHSKLNTFLPKWYVYHIKMNYPDVYSASSGDKDAVSFSTKPPNSAQALAALNGWLSEQCRSGMAFPLGHPFIDITENANVCEQQALGQRMAIEFVQHQSDSFNCTTISSDVFLCRMGAAMSFVPNTENFMYDKILSDAMTTRSREITVGLKRGVSGWEVLSWE